jgi:anti-sigma B factor antagonist/serine/threonine-protein kinase RsbW
MAVERHLIIPGILSKVPEACDFVVQAAESAGLDERSVYYCCMAVDEWCTNIIEHGYNGEDEHNRIEITCENKKNYVSIMIVDESPPFDPTSLSVEEPSRFLEEREPGGLGWFFIRKIMDEVHYEYRDGRNCLTMIKRGVEVAGAANAEPDAEDEFSARELTDGIWIILPNGRLDATTGHLLEDALSKQLDASHTRLVVDMSAVTYISSGGLKVLVSAWRAAQKLGGNVVLVALTPRVRKVFEISGFDTLFTISASVEDAAATIGSISNKTK